MSKTLYPHVSSQLHSLGSTNNLSVQLSPAYIHENNKQLQVSPKTPQTFSEENTKQGTPQSSSRHI